MKLLILFIFIYIVNNALSEEIQEMRPLRSAFTIVVIGSTGTGKSSLLNLFANETAFEENDTAESVTKMSSKRRFHFMGDQNELILELIDTQGLQESSHQDSNNIEQMVEEIRKNEKIDLFLLCLDSGNPRFTSYLDSTIRTFIRIFGNDFLNHVVLVFNKWNYAVYSDQEKEKRQHEFQRITQEKFNIEPIPCFFLDSHFNRKIARVNQETGESEIASLSPNVRRKNKQELFEFLSYLKSKKTYLDSVKAQVIKSTEQAFWALLEWKEKVLEIVQRDLREKELELRSRKHGFGPFGLIEDVAYSVAISINKWFQA